MVFDRWVIYKSRWIIYKSRWTVSLIKYFLISSSLRATVSTILLIIQLVASPVLTQDSQVILISSMFCSGAPIISTKVTPSPSVWYYFCRSETSMGFHLNLSLTLRISYFLLVFYDRWFILDDRWIVFEKQWVFIKPIIHSTQLVFTNPHSYSFCTAFCHMACPFFSDLVWYSLIAICFFLHYYLVTFHHKFKALLTKRLILLVSSVKMQGSQSLPSALVVGNCIMIDIVDFLIDLNYGASKPSDLLASKLNLLSAFIEDYRCWHHLTLRLANNVSYSGFSLVMVFVLYVSYKQLTLKLALAILSFLARAMLVNSLRSLDLIFLKDCKCHWFDDMGHPRSRSCSDLPSLLPGFADLVSIAHIFQELRTSYSCPVLVESYLQSDALSSSTETLDFSTEISFDTSLSAEREKAIQTLLLNGVLTK